MTAPSATPRALLLVIDDSETSLRARTLLLEHFGYEVVSATSVPAALELFSALPIRLVVTDHMLAEGTGTEIARAMKQQKPEVPILILSGLVDKPEGADVADEFLVKGESPETLLAAIERLLKK